MNAFHVIGGITAIYAVVVGILGITRADFPRGAAQKAVGALSVLLVTGTIGAAIITSATEEEEHGGGQEEATQTPQGDQDVSEDAGGHQEADPEAGPGDAGD